MRNRIADWFRRRGLSPVVTSVYVVLVLIFLVAMGEFYIPGKGFSYLIAFGGRQERISKVRRLDFHVQRSSDGYDAQYYVQIAMDPSLTNRELRQAVDGISYRGRRILFPAIAWALGLGEPELILQVFALENVLAWMLLALLLLHWFPPRSWDDLIRWGGVLYSFGLTVSCSHALIDGPSLLFIAFGVFLLDKGRPWLSTIVLALGGLGKETNALAAAGLLPSNLRDARGWVRAAVQGVLVGLPLALWVVYLAAQFGHPMDPGFRNFAVPLAGYVGKWREVVRSFDEVTPANFGPVWSLLALVALTAQFVFLVLRPRWSQAWWRIGFSFAILMIFLGEAVWEGYPGAASRVLLPMQLAFNVLVPRGTAGWRSLLIIGNLTVLAAPTALEAPQGEGYVLRGEHAALVSGSGASVKVTLGTGWYSAERSGSEYWVWTSGPGNMDILNPHDHPLTVRLRFGISAIGSRTVGVKLNGGEIWRTTVPESSVISARLNGLELKPGANRFEFFTDEAAGAVEGDPRPLAFCVHDLRIDAVR